MENKFKEIKEKLLNENSPIIQGVFTPTINPKTVLTDQILKEMLLRDAKGCASFLGNAVLFHNEDDLIKAKEILANVGFTEQETDHWFNDKVGLHVYCKRQPTHATTELYISIDGVNPYKFINMLNTLQYGWLGVEKPIPVTQPSATESDMKTQMTHEMMESVECTCGDVCEESCQCGCHNDALTEEEKIELEQIQKEEIEESKSPENADDPKPYDDKYLPANECWWVHFEECVDDKGTVMLESKLYNDRDEVIQETITQERVFRDGKMVIKYRTDKPGHKIVRDGNRVYEKAMSPEEQRKRRMAAFKSKFKRRAKKTSLFRKRFASIKKHKSRIGYKPYKKRK